jgi:hypothetical protein
MRSGPLRADAGARRLQPDAPLDFDCAFVPHADYLIIASNFCQAPVAKPSPRPAAGSIPIASGPVPVGDSPTGTGRHGPQLRRRALANSRIRASAGPVARRDGSRWNRDAAQARGPGDLPQTARRVQDEFCVALLPGQAAVSFRQGGAAAAPPKNSGQSSSSAPP